MAAQRRRISRRIRQLELNEISIRNFRSIRDQKVQLKPLTIVVGGNSAGKSSLLKAILLMSQAQRERNLPGEIPLNGLWTRLEQFGSVVNKSAPGQPIEIGLSFGVRGRLQLTKMRSCRWIFVLQLLRTFEMRELD
jgi:recombinational DNA repair ATPase RecF